MYLTSSEPFTVLIVPYGIETIVYRRIELHAVFVLIVPYGIETEVRM